MGRRGLEAKSQQIPQGLEPILPVDLLPFLVGPAEIPNPDLVDAPAPRQRDLRTDLDLEPEIVAGDVQAVLDRAREHLVADLDVGESLVVQCIEQERDEAVAEIMMKVERAMGTPVKARSIDH